MVLQRVAAVLAFRPGSLFLTNRVLYYKVGSWMVQHWRRNLGFKRPKGINCCVPPTECPHKGLYIHRGAPRGDPARAWVSHLVLQEGSAWELTVAPQYLLSRKCILSACLWALKENTSVTRQHSSLCSYGVEPNQEKCFHPSFFSVFCYWLPSPRLWKSAQRLCSPQSSSSP